MKPKIVIRLSSNWRVLADDQQFIVAKAYQRRGERDWRYLAYVATHKRVLAHLLSEFGAEIDAEGSQALARLPDSFREWKAVQARRAAA